MTETMRPTSDVRERQRERDTSGASVPFPRATSSASHSAPSRRLSLNVPSARAQPLAVPVPQRHGSGRQRDRDRASFGSASFSESTHRRPLGSSLSLWASREQAVEDGYDEAEGEGDMGWLETRADQMGGDEACVVPSGAGMEQAVETLLGSGQACLLVDRGQGRHAFVDFADVNVFLLLVLRASSQTTTGTSPDGGDNEVDRCGQIIRLLSAGKKVPVEAVCDISEKNPIHAIDPSTPLAHLLPLLATGVHRVLVTTTPPRILSAAAVLEHLATSRAPPAHFQRTFISPSLDLPLHPLVSLSGTCSVLDAMQVMSLNGLSALGVLSGSSGSSATSIRHHRAGSTSSGSSGGGQGQRSSRGSFSFQRSPSQVFATSPATGPLATSPMTELPSPFDALGGSGGPELVNVITAETCARLVVPSEGKQALGMGLEQATKAMQVIEHAGQARGEERVPVHTITPHSSLLHASHLILATSSSRIFLRTPYGLSPPLSPTPSLSTSQTSPPSSPSVSSLSLSDLNIGSSAITKAAPSSLGPGASASTSAGLPPPPTTQLSPHYVVSISDILASLARAYKAHLPVLPSHQPPIGGSSSSVPAAGATFALDPETMTRKRRDSVNAAVASAAVGGGAGVGVAGSQTLGLDSWKWASPNPATDEAIMVKPASAVVDDADTDPIR